MTSRKHYEAVAAIIRPRLNDEQVAGNNQWDDGYETAVRSLAWDLADIFTADNPAFDPDRFIKACGIKP